MEAVARRIVGNRDGARVTIRIVVTGPESTGKSTLAAVLGDRLRAPVVPEAARRYAEAQLETDPAHTLLATDVAPIARLAMSLEEQAMAARPAVAVFDTDLVSTVVYARHYYGSAPAWVEAEARQRRGDLYLLCATDLPWTADGIRDRPSAREELLRAFGDAMCEFGCTAEWVEGTGVARLESAVRALGQHDITRPLGEVLT